LVGPDDQANEGLGCPGHAGPRNAETKLLSAISDEMKDLAARARKLRPEEYQGLDSRAVLSRKLPRSRDDKGRTR
jgi:hypothetical protein